MGLRRWVVRALRRGNDRRCVWRSECATPLPGIGVECELRGRRVIGNGHEAAAWLLEQAPDALVCADLEGRIRFWNAAAERMFGHSSTSAAGQSLDLIIPVQFRDAHWRGYRAALAAGETKYVGQSLATKAVRADGEQIYIELSFAIVRDAAGSVIGALAHARDITERFQRERETRRRLRALEEELEQLHATRSSSTEQSRAAPR